MPTVILILSVTILQLLSLSLMVEVVEADYLDESMVSASDVHFVEKRGTPGVCVESGQLKTWIPIRLFQSLRVGFRL